MYSANAAWPLDLERAIDRSSRSIRASPDMKTIQDLLDVAEYFVILFNSLATVMRVVVFLIFFEGKSHLLKAFSIFHLTDVRNSLSNQNQN